MKRTNLISIDRKTKIKKGNEFHSDGDDNDDFKDLPSDVKVALETLYDLFPDDLKPRLALKHQLYSVLQDRTTADAQLKQLEASKQIILLRINCNDIVICDRKCYIEHLRKSKLEQRLRDKYIRMVIQNITDLSVSKKLLIDSYKFLDSDITKLIGAGVLSIRDGNSWWLFMNGIINVTKPLFEVRKQLIARVKKSKYKEILQTELICTKIKGKIINMKYHMHDLIGGEFVNKVNSPMGSLLRYESDDD